MCGLSIKLEGFPEQVQRIADVLDEAFPGMMVWVQADDDTDGIAVKIEGFENPVMPMQVPRPIAA